MTGMRSAGIAVIGVSSLIMFYVFVEYVELFLLCLGVIICLLVIMGFLREGHKPGRSGSPQPENPKWPIRFLRKIRSLELRGVLSQLMTFLNGWNSPFIGAIYIC